MPHINRAERVHLRLVLVAALNQICLEATEELEAIADEVVRNDDPEPERLQALWQTVTELRERLDNLASSAEAVRLAELSLT